MKNLLVALVLPALVCPVWRERGLTEARNVLVISVGGFMGVGERKVVVPWSDLKVTSDGKKHVATLEQAKLESAPRWDRIVSGDGEPSAPAASPTTTK